MHRPESFWRRLCAINAAAVLVLGLGCENLTHEQFVEELGDYDADRVKFLTCQEVEDEFEAGRNYWKNVQPMPDSFTGNRSR